MIVRKYGRRRGGTASTHPDSMNGAVSGSFRDCLSSQESEPQDFYGYPFSSQESSSLWPSSVDPSSFHHNPSSIPHRKSRFDGNFENDVVGRAKRSRSQGSPSRGPTIPLTSTLMEAQEFGEMMEHVDEVNFALDGLKKGQQVRIRRASLCSLMSICSTPQQRRFLKAQGIVKTIVDAILGLSLDDTLSNMAAAALFFVLTGEGQDEHLLESPRSVRFLIKLLKPVVSAGSEEKARKIGYNLLSLLKDTETVRDTAKKPDSSSSDIVSRVQDILVSSKEVKSIYAKESGIKMPDSSPKWIALLTMERACLSKISFEDASGAGRKTKGSFKEKLRELGGLDAVFEVAMDCYSVMEGWMEQGLLASQINQENNLNKQSLMLLLKCLKIMENATFLSKENQSHLLSIKRSLNSHVPQLPFAELMFKVIKILSGLCLLRRSCSVSREQKLCDYSARISHVSDLVSVADTKVHEEIISISSTNSSNSVKTLSRKSSSVFRNTISSLLGCPKSDSEMTTASMTDPCIMKIRFNPSYAGSCSGRLGPVNGGMSGNSNVSRMSSDPVDGACHTNNDKMLCLEETQDPYAFDVDDFEPTKWDLLSGKQKVTGAQKPALKSREIQHEFQHQLKMSQESNDGSDSQNHESGRGDLHHSQESSNARVVEECCTLVAECLLTGVKVLMNLTNDNPSGCQQIAACGGLETMSSLIARHFPSFSSSPSLFAEVANGQSGVANHPRDCHLTEQELDLLVAILGLLVNLVEKDGINRSRLAAASVPFLEGLEESHCDVIPLLCSIFLVNRGVADAAEGGKALEWDDEDAVLEGEKEAEKMIVEAYAALLLAFLSTESESIRSAIADCLPSGNLAVLVPVLERFVAFHLTLNMISPETHKAVTEVIESCRVV